MENYKPIGTVVRLEQASQVLFMIVGIIAVNENGETRDYVGIKYPVGVMGDFKYFFFNEGDIQEIVHMGYINEDHQAFSDLMRAALERSQTNISKEN